MNVTARDLRQRAADVLRAVRNGEPVTITYRGKIVGVIRPQVESGDRAFEPVGFGLWKRDARARNVKATVDRLRGARHHR